MIMAEFNVQGTWQMIQGGSGGNDFVVTVTLNPARPDGSFSGFGSFSQGTGAGLGLVRDDIFTFRIRWTNGSEGAYIGVFNDQGFLNGASFNVQQPSQVAGWHSDHGFSRG
jgi:hypothetical protein